MKALSFCAVSGWVLAWFFSPALSAGAAPASQGTPHIEFESTSYDFGKLTGAESVAGVFKFKNTGDGTLQVGPVEPGCGCTEAKAKPESLAPGQSGEITYTIKLEQAMHGAQKRMRVHSNDPKNPDVVLTMKLDYTPLYEISPTLLHVFLPAGQAEVQGLCTIARTDGQPLGIARLTASPEWVSAAFDGPCPADATSARIKVTVHRPPGSLSMMVANVQMWNAQQTNRPVKTLVVSGDVQGEVTARPPRLYWVIPDLDGNTNYPAEALTRQVELKSVLGKPVEIKKVTSTLRGLNVQVQAKDAGKAFDLVLKLDEVPRAFTNAKVIIETSLASLPKLDIPVTLSVPAFK